MDRPGGHPTALERDVGAARWVGAASMPWRLHREVVLLLGWGRAVLLQLAHPLVAAGVADHSSFDRDLASRVQRLRQTLETMLALTFGTGDEVLAAAARINAIHDRVQGTLPTAVGPFPAGTPYSAHDPELLRWVHATFLDSLLRAYDLFVGPLSASERDQYCREASAIEPLLGLPPGFLPRSRAELERYLEGMLASGQIVVGGTARALARAIVAPPAPLPARPLLGLLRLPTVGLLPPTLRAQYGFAWDERRERRLRLLAACTRVLRRAAPPVLRYWPVARAAFRRARAA